MIKLAKTYISSVKYMIKIKFEIDGVVDKPDIIGAVFGQSEGLLGDEMDLKELQKNGKIGRIEINHQNILGKTSGEILLPSNMDMVQTSILAAAVESVEKVGPFESKFEIIALEDTRSEKRTEIKKRAQELLQRFKSSSGADTVEITESVREESRTAYLKPFGPEKLPAGPEVDSSDELIIVEGRADVITLLKNNIKNVIGMQGSTIPKTVLNLSRHKKVTIFVDGDRGGEMIAKNFLLAARAQFIARAPDGKEVEELTRKEIVQSLQKRVTPKEFFDSIKKHSFPPRIQGNGNEFQSRPRIPQRSFESPRQFEGPRSFDTHRKPFQDRRNTRFGSGQRPRPPFRGRTDSFRRDTPRPQTDFEHLPTKEEQEKFLPILKEIKGKSKAVLFDEQMKEITKTDVKNLVKEIEKKSGVHTIVFEGIVTKRLVDTADKQGIKFVVGIKKGKIGKPQTRVLTFSN